MWPTGLVVADLTNTISKNTIQMKKLTFLLVLACIAGNINAQLLWKISGNGLESPSYIIGTHHLAPLSVLDSIAGLKDAFDSSQEVIGELVVSDFQTPEVMQAMQKVMMINNDTTIQQLFMPNDYEMVNQYTKENLMLDLAMAPKLKPAFLQNNLVVLLYMKTYGGVNPEEQIDGYFQAEATKKGKKVSSLETPEFQFNLLYNGTSLQRQADLLVCALSDLDKSMQGIKDITEAYIKHDINEMLSISKRKEGTKCDGTPEEMAAMNDDRNKNWAEILPAKMQATPLFVAVGALHLPGDTGILNLLRQKGYQVEAVL